jgi:hypothetical protein
MIMPLYKYCEQFISVIQFSLPFSNQELRKKMIETRVIRKVMV